MYEASFSDTVLLDFFGSVQIQNIHLNASVGSGASAYLRINCRRWIQLP